MQKVTDVLEYGIEHQKAFKAVGNLIATKLDLPFGDFDHIKNHPFDYSVGKVGIEIETYQKSFYTIEKLKLLWGRGISIPLRRLKPDKAQIWVKLFPNSDFFIAVDLKWALESKETKDNIKELKNKSKHITRKGKGDDLENNYFMELPWNLVDNVNIILNDVSALTALIKNRQGD